MGTMTKWPVQKHTEHHKHGVYKDATDIKKQLFLCFSNLSVFFFQFSINWGFKPVFRCSKPHTFSTFSGEEKEKNVSIHSF